MTLAVHSKADIQAKSQLGIRPQPHGLTDVEFEPSIEGTSKRPDYRLRADGMEALLEVKEFNATSDDFGVRGGAYNPYGPIREKIGAAGKKFKDMEGRCCCLVLHNHEPLIRPSWQIVMGAMLGDLGYSFPVDTTTGKADLSRMSRSPWKAERCSGTTATRRSRQKTRP